MVYNAFERFARGDSVLAWVVLQEGSEETNDDDTPRDSSANPPEQANTYVLKKTMAASTERMFDAWVNRFDSWFASPGEIGLTEVPGEP